MIADRVIRSSTFSRVIIFTIISPLAFITLYFLYYREFWGALVVSAIFFYIYLDVHSSTIIIKDGNITLKQFWRKKWSCELNSCKMKSGRGGDAGILPVIEVWEKKNSKLIGVIKKTYFSPQNINELLSIKSN